jgi:hypothetical protein
LPTWLYDNTSTSSALGCPDGNKMPM